MQRKIDFLIVGAQKCGTTSLYHYLGQHPRIFLPKTKEIRYFASDEFYQQGEKYLDMFYQELAQEQVIGGAYVHLMAFPRVPKRIHEYNDKMKLISLLRNPIDRAYSAFWFARRQCWETAETFEQAVDIELQRRPVQKKSPIDCRYLAHGHYYTYLMRLIELFGHAKVKILLTDDLLHQPENVVRETLQFLGVEPELEGMDVRRMQNRAKMPRFRLLPQLLQNPQAWHNRAARSIVPQNIRYIFRRMVTKRLIRLNERNFSYPEMIPETRARLQVYYQKHNENLTRLLGRELDHWQ